MKEPKTSLWVVLLVFAVAILIALLDGLFVSAVLPWHGLFVIPVVWIALWSAEEDAVPVTTMAVIVTILILLPGYFSHERLSRGWFGERLVVIGSIWATVFLALARKRGRRTYRWVSLIGRR
ncbi:MAG: hypothetical protein ICV75_02665 [Nitrospiraceae bacterium]|nr:hypothetical protein [Nitrospiraceae bacterium]